MKVRIRHIGDTEARNAGEMNPEQLHHFVNDLRARGVFASPDGNEGCDLMDASDASYQYIDEGDGGNFVAEIIYGGEAS